MSSKLRIIPLGGCGEIGKNMTVLEYEDEILVVDAGIMFPENDMLGIDAIIPDYNYLLDKADKIKAILITHGHEDHIGAIGHLMADIDAPIYATPLTVGLIEVKLRRANLLHHVTLRTMQAGDAFAIGAFLIEPFHVAHSIPDCVGFGITTPVGIVVHTGDYKFDHTPSDGWPPDFAKLAEFSMRGVLCLLADSTNAERPGWTPSETVITEAFDRLFQQARGRIIIATFASLISRIQLVADMAQKYGRKLAITGRSMRENTKMARRLGYLEIPEDLLIDINDAARLPAHQVAIMATGSQGEPTAVLGRLAMGDHRTLRVQQGDTVVLSAHPIPGNEEMIHRIINRLMQRGADVLYDAIALVHVSGHAASEEMKLMINLVRPRFFVPIHGELRHLRQHARMAQELGIPAENIAVVENGTVLELDDRSLAVGPRIPGGYVFVDGASVGEIGSSVMRDREQLAQNGFFLAVATLGRENKLIGQPEFISRGFANLDETPELLQGAVDTVARVISQFGSSQDRLSSRIEDALGRYLYAETGRRPLVYVVLR
ncbi:MAG: ribonuclease J [Anaerolineales bacterium]|nr:ribonuclease J [Anaerolineales bacterium]MCB8951038.1 ribonuclease J [Ardenticatenales bacterium]